MQSAGSNITVSNPGAGAITISGIVSSSVSEFPIVGNTCGVVAGGTSCTIAVAFKPPFAGARAGTLSISSNGTGSPNVVALSGTGTAGAPSATKITVVEYYNAAFGHYFMTADPDEIKGLDGGAYNFAFIRTGRQFSAWNSATAGTVPVCRFFTTPGTFGNKSSHFYTANQPECNGLKLNPNWVYEKVAFHIAVPSRRMSRRTPRRSTGCTTTGRPARRTTGSRATSRSTRTSRRPRTGRPRAPGSARRRNAAAAAAAPGGRGRERQLGWAEAPQEAPRSATTHRTGRSQMTRSAHRSSPSSRSSPTAPCALAQTGVQKYQTWCQGCHGNPAENRRQRPKRQRVDLHQARDGHARADDRGVASRVRRRCADRRGLHADRGVPADVRGDTGRRRRNRSSSTTTRASATTS